MAVAKHLLVGSENQSLIIPLVTPLLYAGTTAFPEIRGIATGLGHLRLAGAFQTTPILACHPLLESTANLWVQRVPKLNKSECTITRQMSTFHCHFRLRGIIFKG